MWSKREREYVGGWVENRVSVEIRDTVGILYYSCALSVRELFHKIARYWLLCMKLHIILYIHV